MFRTSRQFEVALQAMLFIGQHKKDGDRDPVNIREICESLDLPQPFTAKICQHLARRGLLVSHQGSQGGFTLAWRPERISVLDILEAVEGRFTLSDRIEFKPGETDVKFRSAIALDLAEHRIRETLGKMTLAVLLYDCEPLGDPTWADFDSVPTHSAQVTVPVEKSIPISERGAL